MSSSDQVVRRDVLGRIIPPERYEPRDRPLSFRQQRFVEFFTGNATEAARLAGYKGNANTLGQVGHKLVTTPKIIAAIGAKNSKRDTKAIANKDERKEFWTAAMRGKDVTPQQVKASELLGKCEGDFIERNLNVNVDLYDLMDAGEAKASSQPIEAKTVEPSNTVQNPETENES